MDAFTIEQLQQVGIIILAALLGGVIGFERESAGRPAGLRTHILVTAAAATVVLFHSEVVDYVVAHAGSNVDVRVDPGRILEAVFVAIGFIGGGTILKSQQKKEVYYLSTAASLLFAAVIGIVTAIGSYIAAIILTFFTVAVTRVLFYVEARYFGKATQKE